MAWTYYTSRQHHRRKKLDPIGITTRPQPQKQRQHIQCFRSSNCVRLNNLVVAVFISSLLILKCPSDGASAQVCMNDESRIHIATNRPQQISQYEFLMAILLKKCVCAREKTLIKSNHNK